MVGLNQRGKGGRFDFEKSEVALEYLIRIVHNGLLAQVREKAKAHYWLGDDTACRMASTGGLQREKFRVFGDPMGKPICHMCEIVAAKSGGVAEKGDRHD